VFDLVAISAEVLEPLRSLEDFFDHSPLPEFATLLCAIVLNMVDMKDTHIVVATRLALPA
jgi:hypothetical protein